jgi:lipopolysaccharide transport system ATP-binding protein
MLPVIQVENLSKAYQIGEFGTGTLSHDVKRWFIRMRGKEDPYLKIAEANDRTVKGEGNIVWSLNDVSFNIMQGEAFGIIGRNGAGKSTLLKILSRITSPTSGSVKLKGRIASLLEVGTGFHPELSGRENIYLNGAILGMRRGEIKRKFDEIVDFSGVQRYIDTPVKRYSSGMYVRLAFAVAAHLESEILIVDEVLAVGDAEFQKKCLGKMGDVSKGEGRTILFVSHNMTAINSLCKQVIYLKNGHVVEIGETEKIIHKYASTETDLITENSWLNDKKGDEVAQLLKARLINRNNEAVNIVFMHEEVGVEFQYRVVKSGYQPLPNLHLYNIKGDHVFVSSETTHEKFLEKGLYKAVMWIPADLLNDGRYLVGIALSTLIPEKIHFYIQEALIFDIVEDMELRNSEYRGSMPGVIRPKLEWQTSKID